MTTEAEEALIQAARELLAVQPSYRGGYYLQGREERLYVRLLDMTDAVEKERELVWVERTFKEVRVGDRIRLGGQEAEVQRNVPLNWHTLHETNDRKPIKNGDIIDRLPFPREHDWTECQLTLVLDHGQPEDFTINGALSVEIGVTRAQLAAIEALGGWEARLS